MRKFVGIMLRHDNTLTLLMKISLTLRHINQQRAGHGYKPNTHPQY